MRLLIRCWLLLVLIGVGVIAPQSSQAQDAQEQPAQITIDGLAVKLPFQPGAEWQVTAGWEAANHQQAWNYYAVDVVPVNQACLGQPILAVAHGFIESNNGHELQIDHRVNNYRSLYSHLDTVSPGLAVGTEVFQGQQIGTCGGYPNFVPHLHFQIFQGARVASSGVMPVPIDGITDANRLRSGQRGLYSTNQFQPQLPPAPSQQNLVLNGDFSAGTTNWWKYGDAAWSIVDQGLNFRRNPGGTGGSVGQNLAYQFAANTPIEAQFDLGNPSGVTKHVGVFIRHESSWDQPIHCGFTLPPYSPMQRFSIRGRSGSVVWNKLTFEVWADPPDGIPDVRMDNVAITYRTDIAISAKTCIAPAPSQQNLVRNGDFSAGTADWWRYGDASWGIVDQALNFRRNPGGDGGSVGQNLPYRLNPNAPLEVQFDLGNPSGVTKYAGVFIRHSSSWDQPIHCGFTLPPYSPMQRYVVRGRSGSVVWNELTFEVWADPPDGTSDLRMDNVAIAYRPELYAPATTCIAPAPSQQNLVRNGDFSAGTADWWRYGDASWAIVDQGLNFKRNPGGDGGSVGQNLPYRLTPNAPLEVQFDLGNPSGVTKYAGVFIRHSSSWDQPIHCGFMLPAYSPMQRYVVRGRSGSVVWNELTFEIWADPPDGIPDLRMDNVAIAYRPDLAINATTCIAPTANQEQPNQCLVQIDQGAQFTANLNVDLEFRVDQAATMRVSNQPLDSSIAWQPYQASLDWLLTSSLLGNNRTVYAEFRDSQGTMLCAGHELRDDIRLDTTAPNLIEMQVYPFAASLGLAITASDDPTGSGINAVQLSSRADFSGSTWLPYSPVIDLEGLPNSTLYVRVRDSVGNSSAAQSIAISTQQTYRLYLPMTSDQ
ncbi:M23 family metallopeptidase [Herpetosiphon gulosus]